MLQEQNEICPSEYFKGLQNAFAELIEVAKQNSSNYTTDLKPYKSPTLHSILQKVEQLNENEIPDQKPSDNLELKKNQLLEYHNNADLITTNFYTQSVIAAMQVRKVKNEAINCAYIHALQGFPCLKQEQEKLKNCQLQSYQLAQEQEFRFLKSIQPNVYQLYKIKQISNHIQDKFIVHFTIYHPFTNKKMQIIIATNDATLEQVMQQIDCPVESTEKMFFQDELSSFDPPQISVGQKQAIIGHLKFVLCKQYTYTHLNQCKHRIYINEIRSLTQNEEINTPYARTIYKAPLKIRGCDGCGRSAQLFRISDQLIPNSSPVFLCKFCNDNLHSNDKEKILQYFCD
ncbi:unnamed protein product [Paramecium sonneborni]|uniref:snRNA-activating protein complex subunit 3 n=1 Tax=Paramecium sonneborni TaxID=65129 RepID=A0A8S1R3J4_9CILI|nr:unnamed protein product [Paramecium sonneborni]